MAKKRESKVPQAAKGKSAKSTPKASPEAEQGAKAVQSILQQGSPAAEAAAAASSNVVPEGPSGPAVPGKKGGAIRAQEFAKRIKSIWGGIPLWAKAGGGALLGAGAIPPLLAGMRNSLNTGQIKDKKLEQAIRGSETRQKARRYGEDRTKRLQRLTQENMAILMATTPRLAAQLMAGQKLPQGAVVIGGQPRMDLIQEVAQGMAMGQYGPGVPDDTLPSQMPGMDPMGGGMGGMAGMGGGPDVGSIL